ncbi:hypothetical protein H0H92_001532 [Tricholoma furcatifolium]|nr:hypothetical protein H0H92_001532 [Tricholoma furcatifolium]
MQRNTIEPVKPVAIQDPKKEAFYPFDDDHNPLSYKGLATVFNELWGKNLYISGDGYVEYPKFASATSPETAYFIVEFKAGRKGLFHTTWQSRPNISVGDMVFVEGEGPGVDLGKVSGKTLAEVKGFISHERSKGRKATPKILFRKVPQQQNTLSMLSQSLEEKAECEARALQVCQDIARAQNLAIEVVDAEYQWDRRKLTFYFTSEDEIDFLESISRGQASRTADMTPMVISPNPLEQPVTSPKEADPPLQISSKPSDQMEDLIQKVQAILKDKQEYRKLLARRDVHAQGLLATASELYPISYELSNIATLELPECNGGFADIYKGDFQGLPVCVKTIRLHKATEMHHFMKVVSKEAVLWEQLRHPNLVPFYGIYRYKGRLSLVAPWMENGNIEDYLKRQTTSNRVGLAYDVAQGLKFLHENKIIHGDLKGAAQKNILVNDSGRACVADFGLSSVSDKEILAWTSCSSAASKGGSLRWQAPELFESDNGEERRNTMESDIYAWGCVAYEIFAGDVPFARLNREAAIINYVSKGGQPTRPAEPSISWNVWGLTEDIWTLMKTCWSPQPDMRPRVNAVVDHLSSSFPPGVHETIGDQTLSTGQFREMMRLRSDKIGMTVQTFESLLRGL